MFELTQRIPIWMSMLALAACMNHGEVHLDQSENEQDKFYPSDHFLLQRAYPDLSIDLQSLSRDLIQLKRSEKKSTTKRSAGIWRNQGPANVGARINTVAGHPEDSSVLYAGFSSGGLYKTQNGGEEWTPIFDEFPFLAIGDITLDPNDPNTVYLGTGDPNISGNPFIGNGIFRSRDAGSTWESLGLAETGIISKIIVDPSDSDVIYVATMGVPYFRSQDRGLYKTTDAGNSWEQILFLGEGTGVIDLVMAPDDPEVLLASGWDRIRNYEESTTFGEGARIYRTTDGGSSWQMLTAGLPLGVHSRIGLDVTPDNPQRVYAFYVSSAHEVGGVYTSADQGTTWDTIPWQPEDGMPANALGGFGWFFGKIRANPFDELDVFLLGVRLRRFDATTQTWSRADIGDVHADKHDMFFFDERSYILATDGGLYKSPNGTDQWEDIENIPATQFYHAAYNPHAPDIYYGGTQDNGSVRGNGSQPENWEPYFGGDGFRTIFHPTDPLIWYVETQRGGLAVTIDGGDNFLSGRLGVDGADNRNWDVPVIMSSHDPNVLYYGTTRVFRNSTGAEVAYHAFSQHLVDEPVLLDATSNVTTIAESYFDPNTVFAGTGDGNLWRSTDGDTIWTRIGLELPDRYYTSIHCSPTIAGNVFISLSGYKAGENLPHIFMSSDDGEQWTDISGDLMSLPVNDLFILPNNDDQVVFAATDAGVYFTINQGDNWKRLGNNMPTIAVFDLAYNEAKNQIIAATFGKSIYTFDLEQEGLRGDGTSSIVIPDVTPVSIYPNPAYDVIRFSDPLKGAPIEGYEILDNQGQQLFFVDYDKPLTEVSISILPPGIYYLRFAAVDQLFLGRFVKM